MDMNFQTILSSFKNQSTGTDAFKNLKNACEQYLKQSSNLNEKAATYLIYGFARSYVILYEDEAVTTEFAQASKEALMNHMNHLNEALLTENHSTILSALNQVSNDYMQGPRVF
ncbi:hypothetical protein [Acinetobacter nosocomialis]|uniref:hypothetical protein n=1 Tax=Acinetobacter nosocomialis TaxID=106654 RepID=UPI001ADD3AB6|nr:hypothetical protein [Acinetobacter nosocomialis]MBO8208019.1 hypothetical protein [Acinetobacter nosocomialis]MBO8224470.1 hypothetical protein [Acinetobacter nosocomialis]MBO8250221.1 hypothetical protein [Acinetobacter nosocomialis]MDH2591352.1 hypothetical protein [Acinetobacter nosocomialis]